MGWAELVAQGERAVRGGGVRELEAVSYSVQQYQQAIARCHDDNGETYLGLKATKHLLTTPKSDARYIAMTMLGLRYLDAALDTLNTKVADILSDKKWPPRIEKAVRTRNQLEVTQQGVTLLKAIAVERSTPFVMNALSSLSKAGFSMVSVEQESVEIAAALAQQEGTSNMDPSQYAKNSSGHVPAATTSTVTATAAAAPAAVTTTVLMTRASVREGELNSNGASELLTPTTPISSGAQLQGALDAERNQGNATPTSGRSESRYHTTVADISSLDLDSTVTPPVSLGEVIPRSSSTRTPAEREEEELAAVMELSRQEAERAQQEERELELQLQEALVLSQLSQQEDQLRRAFNEDEKEETTLKQVASMSLAQQQSDEQLHHQRQEEARVEQEVMFISTIETKGSAGLLEEVQLQQGIQASEIEAKGGGPSMAFGTFGTFGEKPPASSAPLNGDQLSSNGKGKKKAPSGLDELMSLSSAPVGNLQMPSNTHARVGLMGDPNIDAKTNPFV